MATHYWNVFRAIFPLVIFLSAPVGAAVEISGFIDYRYDDAQNASKLCQFRPGNGMELALDAQLTEKLVAKATLISGGNNVALGPSFLDFHFFDQAAHATHGSDQHAHGIMRTAGLQVGLFDIPFGIESRYYSSVDRPTISQPFLTGRLLAGGWTDVGAHLFIAGGGGRLPRYDLSVFALDGFLWNNGNDAVFRTADDGGLTIPTNAPTNGLTAGGRIGLHVRDGIEIGASLAKGAYRAQVSGTDPRMELLGLDASATFGRIRGRAEYVDFTGDDPGRADIRTITWYLEGEFDLTKSATLVGRFDEIDYNVDRDFNLIADDDLRAFLAGVRFAVTENVALRAEYQNFRYQKRIEAQDDAFRSSIVVGF